MAASAQHDADELAKKLSNPVAALISVPLQLNWDTDIGPAEEGDRFTLNIQPVVPISLTDKWNVGWSSFARKTPARRSWPRSASCDGYSSCRATKDDSS